MEDIYMSNIFKTTLLIIFQHQLGIVVAPKACNFGNSVRIEIKCGGDLWLISGRNLWFQATDLQKSTPNSIYISTITLLNPHTTTPKPPNSIS